MPYLSKIKLNGVEYDLKVSGDSMVTGVKGNAEAVYRHGDINLTPENIGTISTEAEQTLTDTQKLTGRTNLGLGTAATRSVPSSGNANATQVVLGSDTRLSVGNQTPEFEQAASRENIASGESVSTIFGKIKKFFADLKTVAFTGSYADLSDKPNYAGSSSVGGPANYVAYLHSNEINFKGGAQTRCWFNYRNAESEALEAEGTAIEYFFGNYGGKSNQSNLNAKSYNGVRLGLSDSTPGYYDANGTWKAFKSQADIDAAVSAARVGNAADGDVRSGKTYTNSSSSGRTGTFAGQEKTVTAGTSAASVTPDSGKWLSKVTYNPTPSQSKSASPSTSAQTISPDSGKLLSSVSISAISPQRSAGVAATTSGALNATNKTGYVYFPYGWYPNHNSNYGCYCSVTKAQAQAAHYHTETFTTSTNSTAVNMGEMHSYRYVNTTGVYNAGNSAGKSAVGGAINYKDVNASYAVKDYNDFYVTGLITGYRYTMIVLAYQTGGSTYSGVGSGASVTSLDTNKATIVNSPGFAQEQVRSANSGTYGGMLVTTKIVFQAKSNTATIRVNLKASMGDVWKCMVSGVFS